MTVWMCTLCILGNCREKQEAYTVVVKDPVGDRRQNANIWMYQLFESLKFVEVKGVCLQNLWKVYTAQRLACTTFWGQIITFKLGLGKNRRNNTIPVQLPKVQLSELF